DEPASSDDAPVGDDPFASDDAPAGDDPFANLDEPASSDDAPVGDDPFASDDAPAGDDPFANLDEPTAIGDDPFASMDEPAATDGDPFASMDEPTAIGDDPFASMDEPAATDGGDPFASMDEPAATDGGDPFASMDEPADDPFANIAPDTTANDDSGFDDFSPDLGSNLGDFDDVSTSGDTVEDDLDDMSTDLDDDLTSLAEGEPIEEGEISDEEMAIIQQEIISYPPKLKRTIIDAITNDKISNKEQRSLLELIKTQQAPQDIADYLTGILGYPVELYDNTGTYSKEGVPVIATDEIYTKEGEFRRRQLIKKTVLGVAAGILLLIGLFSSYKYILRPYQASGQYEMGLQEIDKASREPKNGDLRKKHLINAEKFFGKGEGIEANSVEYLNKFGLAYLKIGEYDKAFEKLFGKIEPALGTQDPRAAWHIREKVPLIRLAPNHSWDDDKLPLEGKALENGEEPMELLVDRSRISRKILKAGAYITSRLKNKTHDNDTYINLARFHSHPARAFKDSQYKNDNLAINYYKQVFTDGEEPHHIRATAGLGRIYYNQEQYSKSAFYYNQIVEKFPNSPVGHEGLLNNYIEMWKKDRNPQFVLNHHRKVMNVLDMEDELSLFILSKLASFYIDLNPKDIMIKYNLNPEDQVTGMDIDDTTVHILNTAFKRSEERDGRTITGKQHAESYYQRGRYFLKRRESIRALKQFEYAANYDPAHYLAVLEMAEHYLRVGNRNESEKLLRNAERRYIKYRDLYGNKQEDETLINGDVGRIYFDLGKIEYFSATGIAGSDIIFGFPERKVYPTRSLASQSEDVRNRRAQMQNSLSFFTKAEESQLKDKTALREMHYYKGWLSYISANKGSNQGFSQALQEWSHLPESDMYNNVNVLMGRANSFYYTNQLEAALGNYLKIQEDFESKMAEIGRPEAEDMRHQEVYQTLSAVYNNIGATYERQNKTAEALQHYWKAVETSRLISSASEISMSNKDMLFKQIRNGSMPLLDDWLPPTVNSIAQMQRMKK
ncbi:MAG: hypothetical protein AAF518_20585, partial [Spirochaetota bacterium]